MKDLGEGPKYTKKTALSFVPPSCRENQRDRNRNRRDLRPVVKITPVLLSKSTEIDCSDAPCDGLCQTNLRDCSG